MEAMPVIRLANGLRIGNHSSPHPFQFVDGSILPACSPERANGFQLTPIEKRSPSPDGRWTDIDLEFALPATAYSAIREDAARPDVDVILVPLPMLLCLRDSEWLGDENVRNKVRCIRVADRISKEIFIDQFCV